MSPVIWAIAFAVSAVVCGLMVVIGPRDEPDGKRKTQERPVPSGGGVGIAVGALAAMVAGNMFVLPGVYTPWLSILAAGLIFLALGFLDDCFDLDARLKTGLLGALSLITVGVGWWLFASFADEVPTGVVISAVLVLGGALWLFVFTNAANFMDGSNGLSLGAMAIMLVALAVMSQNTLGLVAAVFGFLVWNMTGRLYAGDSGALFVGFLVAALGLLGAFAGVYSIWIPPLIGLPFIADVLLTLIWRARKGRKLMHAHNEHAYHLLKRAGWGHWPVALLYWGLTAACCTLAIWAMFGPTHVQLVTFWSAAAVVSALWIWQRMVYWPRVSVTG
ncbi:MAG: hypothetical protein AAF216_08305 [Pseudomonadota bacterium]